MVMVTKRKFFKDKVFGKVMIESRTLSERNVIIRGMR